MHHLHLYNMLHQNSHKILRPNAWLANRKSTLNEKKDIKNTRVRFARGIIFAQNIINSRNALKGPSSSHARNHIRSFLQQQKKKAPLLNHVWNSVDAHHYYCIVLLFHNE
mmetsp:Transcript_18463/g.27861  ORF Transcript_18463/g.27861 Transcript_18463/m.27861 type:complete len:110 (-) Transcript_18463:246-575(-)